MQNSVATRTVLDYKAVAVPVAVKVKGDRILWRRDENVPISDLGGFVEGAGPERTIWEFLELKTAPPEQFEYFANNYGVLGIRTDGLPGVAPVKGDVNTAPIVRVEDDEGLWYIEEVATWRMYSFGLRVALAAAIELRDHEAPEWSTFINRWGLDELTWDSLGLPSRDPGEEVVSETFLRWHTSLSPRSIVENLEKLSPMYQRLWLSNFISSRWVRNGNSVPQLSWTADQDHMSLELSTEYMNLWPANSLFSVVVAQMIDLLTTEKFGRMNQCSVCGRLFVARRKPGPKTKPYCDEHQVEIDRERKRRWAQKAAAERKANASI